MGSCPPTASVTPITFRQGERKVWTAIIKRGGQPVDLTGWNFSSHIRKVPRGGLLASWAIQIDDMASGRVFFILEPEVTASLPATPCEQSWGTDGVAVDPSGTPHMLPQREVVITAAYTR